jgi:hypothetical protein
MPDGPWARRRIVDYWDWRHDALRGGAAALSLLPKKQWPAAANQIRSEVRVRAEALSDSWLVMTASIMVEDLYKSFNNQVWRISPELCEYLHASVGSLLDVLTSRGIALQHVVDNAFAPTEEGLGFPLHGFPDLYGAASLVYICPQYCATQMMEYDGYDEGAFAALMPRYVDEGRLMAASVLERVQGERRHFIYLECDANTLAPEGALRGRAQSGILWVYRNEPPTAGSKCIVVPPAGIDLPTVVTEE